MAEQHGAALSANRTAQTAISDQPPAAPVKPAPLAVATPAAHSSFQLGFFLAGVGMIVVALGLVYLLARRGRALRQPSLISRSFDRQGK